MISRQFSSGPFDWMVTSGSNPRTVCWSSVSNPFITEMTMIMTAIPRVTPRIEMMVITETNDRFGLR